MLRVPIGISDFKILRQDDYYFIDKSTFISEVMDHPAQTLLLPRPRRFGKTLNLSMLAYYLDHREDNRALFKGLAISELPAAKNWAQAYPTIFISFKDIKSNHWPGCLKHFSVLLAELFLTHKDLILAAQPEHLQLNHVNHILEGSGDEVVIQGALALLIQLLHRATGKRVVVLVDEYDTPIHAGFQYGYYSEVVGLIRGLLGAGLKDNSSLQKGVITGIMRVGRESIFSGLNNLKVLTLLDQPFSAHFGFTDREVCQVLQACGQSEQAHKVRTWYNGYRFGNEVIYNPWSILNMVGEHGLDLQAHWVNTSDNLMIRQMVMEGQVLEHELAQVLEGKPVHKRLDSGTALDQRNVDAVWSFFVFGGYLTVLPPDQATQPPEYALVMPNLEVRSFFEDSVGEWLKRMTHKRGLSPLFRALQARDLAALTQGFSDLIQNVLSYHDTAGDDPERVYHAFFLGMLVDQRQDYEVVSNRESGYGRFDLALIPRDSDKLGFLLEFKKSPGNHLQATAQQALVQMTEKNYRSIFAARNIREVYQVGIAIKGKQVALAAETLNTSTAPSDSQT